MTRGFITMTSLAALLSLASTGAFAAKSDQDFIKDAIQGDNSEIMLGTLAQQKGGSQRLKDFARTLVNDHSQAKQEASTVAKALGVAPSDQPMAEAQDEQTKLSSMSGADFDREFASYMVTDHQKDIQEYQDQAKANAPQTSALAKKQLPVLQKHLQMAQALAGNSAQSGGAETPAVLKEAPTQESSDQWRASKLAGVAVYGPDNKKVGNISDILMTRDGKAEFVVVGVGGFLGIGEKDVAIPYDQVKFTDQPLRQGMAAGADPNAANADATGMGAAGGTNAGAGGASMGGGLAPATTVGLGTPADGTAAGGMAGTGGTAATGGMAGAGAPAAGADAGMRSAAYPDHGTIDMTAAQLKSAPTFHFAR